MKKLIVFFIVLLLAIWLGIVIQRYSGFVMINIGHMRIEMTLWTGILTLIVLFTVLYSVIALCRGIYRIPARYMRWSENRSERIANTRMQAAFEALNVRWQVENGQWSAALQMLEALPPRDIFVLQMRKQIYCAQEDWEALRRLLLQVKHKGIFRNKAYGILRNDILFELMKEALRLKNPAEIEELWGKLSRSAKRRPDILAVYVEHLIDQERHREAEALLNRALNITLHPALLLQYARLQSRKPTKQLSRAEAWLRSDPHNPDLLFCLGKLCQHHQLWGKAKKYLSASIKITASQQAYQALGEVLERLHEDAAALACYREGLLKQ